MLDRSVRRGDRLYGENSQELGVPPAIIGRMVVTAPSEMVWFSPVDLQSMEAAMIGKPSQLPVQSAPVATQTQPGPPMRLEQTQRRWLRRCLGKPWLIMKLSTAGRRFSRTLRSCQPEERTCSNRRNVQNGRDRRGFA